MTLVKESENGEAMTDTPRTDVDVFLDNLSSDLRRSRISQDEVFGKLRQRMKWNDHELAEARKDALTFAQEIDPFDTDQSTYELLRKYIPEFPERHPMDATRRKHGK